MSQPWNTESKDEEKQSGKLTSVEELRKVKHPDHSLLLANNEFSKPGESR